MARGLWLSHPGLAIVLAAGIVVSRSGASFAAAKVVSLDYARAGAAAACADEDTIRRGVAARLGYEPFGTGADVHIHAKVTRVGRTFEARIEIVDAKGRTTAERRLSSRGSDCSDLTAAMELAISIAIDPLAGTGAPPSTEREAVVAEPVPPLVVPAVEPRPAPPPAPVKMSVVAEPARPSPPTSIAASAGMIGALGAAPAASIGATVQAAIGRGSLSLAVEGRADFATDLRLSTGSVRTSLLMGSLVPCWHRGWLAGCGVIGAGVLRASGLDLVAAENVSIPFAAVGPRLAVDIPLGQTAILGVHGDVLVPLTETVLRVSQRPVWTSPPVSATLGFSVGARFQ